VLLLFSIAFFKLEQYSSKRLLDFFVDVTNFSSGIIIRFVKLRRTRTAGLNSIQILVMLMRLRQICVHPCLLKAYESAYEGKNLV
jgi:hypothetical protein